MSANYNTEPPARVQAAMNFLYYMRCLSLGDDCERPTRDLSALEQAVHNAALKALQSYFLGEMDYGDVAPPSPAASPSSSPPVPPTPQPQEQKS
jgi:hypothetical protein